MTAVSLATEDELSEAVGERLVREVGLVREVEVWLLADLAAMQALLGKNAKLPIAPDTLPEPKTRLLTLAKMGPRRIRDDLVAEAGAAARQGLGYNNRLCAFVRETWSPQRAASRSPSLDKALQRIRELASRLRSEPHQPAKY